MDELQVGEAVLDAQVRVTAILMELEARTGRTIRSAELQHVDVTTLGSPRKEYHRAFVIEISKPPGQL